MGAFRFKDRSKRNDQRLRNRKVCSCAEPAFRQLALHRQELAVPEEDPPQSVVKRLPPRTRKPTAPK